VVRVDDLRFERLDAPGGLGGRHRVGQVHRDEGEVYILERAHLLGALGVASDVDAARSEGEDVAVAAPFRVEELAGRGAALEVVHRHRLDGDASRRLRLAVGDDGRALDLLRGGGGRDDRRAGLADARDGRRVEVILVDVGDEDEVGLLGGGVVALARRVDVDDLAAVLKLEAGVRDGRDGDVAFLRGRLRGHRGRRRGRL
jgi:hypothetical protein